jgi:hypothetical protein
MRFSSTLNEKGEKIPEGVFKRKSSEDQAQVAANAIGISFHIWPSRRRPAFFLFVPPHCLKKKGVFARLH